MRAEVEDTPAEAGEFGGDGALQLEAAVIAGQGDDLGALKGLAALPGELFGEGRPGLPGGGGAPAPTSSAVTQRSLDVPWPGRSPGRGAAVTTCTPAARGDPPGRPEVRRPTTRRTMLDRFWGPLIAGC